MSDLITDANQHTYHKAVVRKYSVTNVLQSYGLGANAFYTEFGRERGNAEHKACD